MTEHQTTELRTRWRELCLSNFKKDGDYGSCVLGAGLMIGRKMIITAHEVSACQGCTNWERGLDKLLKNFNNEFGTEVFYNPGRMD